MRVMALSCSSRSFVALTTAVLLVLCQTGNRRSGTRAHIVANNNGEFRGRGLSPSSSGLTGPRQRPSTPTTCEASNALPDAAKVPVFAMGDLPTILVAYDLFEPPEQHGTGRINVYSQFAIPLL